MRSEFLAMMWFAHLMTPEQIERMKERMKLGSNMPGWTRRSEFDWFSTLLNPEA